MGVNKIDIIDQNKTLIITNNVLETSVVVELLNTTNINIEEAITNVIEVDAKRGARGPKGDRGDAGQLTNFQDLLVTGSIFASGSLTAVTASIFSISDGFDSRDIIIKRGNSFLATNPTITSTASPRIEFQRDIFMGFNGGLGSTIPSKIFFDTFDTFIAADQENPENLEIHADNNIELRPDGIVHANSIISASGFTGSLEGTSSFSTTASYAINTTSASYSNNATSASYALSASYSNNATSASFSSTTISASYALTASVLALQTGRIAVITASYASSSTSASYALTASYAENAGSGTGFPFTGSADISGSLKVVGDVTFESDRVTRPVTFIVSGSTNISQSLTVGSNITASVINAPLQDTNKTNNGNTIFLHATDASFIPTNPLGVRGGDISLTAGDGSGSSGSGGRINLIAGSGVLNDGIFSVTSRNVKFTLSETYISSSNLIVSKSSGNIQSTVDAGRKSVIKASSFIASPGGFTGSLYGTASWAKDATSASYSFTASYAENAGGSNTGFPYTGSAIISGALEITGSISASNHVSASTYYGDGSNLTNVTVIPFPFTGSAEVSGSFIVDGLLSASGEIIADGGLTIGSGFSLVGDMSASTYFGDGGSLTGIGSIPFPFTGSAEISGSLIVDGVVSASQGMIIDTDVTASGVISSSGELVASTASFETIRSTTSGTPTISSDNNLVLSASLGSVIVHKSLKLESTTTQSILAPSNGVIVYDENQNKFYGYANGAWVAFH